MDHTNTSESDADCHHKQEAIERHNAYNGFEEYVKEQFPILSISGIKNKAFPMMSNSLHYTQR